MTRAKKFGGDDLGIGHRRQIHRFLGLPFDDAEDLRLRAWAGFRRWLLAETKAEKTRAERGRQDEGQ
jgi:hypothetical protein